MISYKASSDHVLKDEMLDGGLLARFYCLGLVRLHRFVCIVWGLFGYIEFNPAENDTYNKKFMINTTKDRVYSVSTTNLLMIDTT
jgi:hypothetical protein